MSFFHKAMGWLGLVDDDEYYADEDQYYVDEYGEPMPAPARQPARVPAAVSAPAPAPAPAEQSQLTVIRTPRERERDRDRDRDRDRERERERVAPAVAATPAPPAARGAAVKPVPMPATRVYVMEPKGFNDAQEVGDRLKGGQPVILNLQGVERDLQRRLIDFSSGLAYALNGTMSKAADQVFLLTPSDVEVSDEEKERLQARGLYRSASRS